MPDTTQGTFQSLDQTITARGLSLSQRLKGAVTGFLNGSFTPGTPLETIAPEGTPPRLFDYSTTFNIDIAPRSNQAVSFQALREIAQSWNVLRIIIERRKDRLAKMPWKIQYAEEGDKKKLTDADKAIEQFFRKPDGEHDFETMLRAMEEQVTVYDALSLEPVYNPDGSMFALYGVNGATIQLKINELGRTPSPPNTAYQQVIKGMPWANFTADQLIYRPMNVRFDSPWGYSKVEQILQIAYIALQRTNQQMYSFSESTIPEAIMQAPENWTSQQIFDLNDYFDSRYSGNLKRRSKMTVVPHGSTLQPYRADPLKNEFDEWMARVACYCLGESPQGFVKEVNRSTSETAQQTAMKEGLEPSLAFFAGLFNEVLAKCFKRPDLRFMWTLESQIDPLVEQQTRIAYIEHGVLGIDEVRQDMGLDPLGIGNMIWTSQGPVLVEDIISGAFKPGASASPDAAPDPTEAIEGAKVAVVEALKLLEVGPVDAAKKKSLKMVHPPAIPGYASKVGKFKDVVLDAFKSGREKITDYVWSRVEPALRKQAAKGTTDGNDKRAKSIADDADLDFLETLGGFTRELYVDVASQGAGAALRSVAGEASISGDDLDALLDQADLKAVAWAEERAAAMVGKRMVDGVLVDNPRPGWSITDSTRSKIQSKVTQALNEGWTREDLASALAEGPFSADSADMIAQTELKLARGESTRIGWKTSGVVKGKRSLLSADHDVEDECDDNADEDVVELDEAYPSGDMGIPFHPRCNCSEVAVLADEYNL